MGHRHVYTLVRETKTKFLNISTSLLLVATGLGAGLPAFITSTAHASPAIPVQPFSLQGWGVQNTGSGATKFIHDATAPTGQGAVRFTTSSNVNDRAALSINTTTKLANVSQLSYETKQNTASFAGGDPAYRLTIDADGNTATTNDTATLVYEPYWQDPAHAGDPAPVVTGTWQTWNVANGVFWASIPHGNAITGLTNGAGGPPFYTLSQLKTLLPNAVITAVSTGIGSYNTDYNVEVDSLDFNGNTYDFEPTPAPTQTSQTVYAQSLSPSSWYFFNDNSNVPSFTNSAAMSIAPNPTPVAGDNGAVRLDGSNGLRSNVATLQYYGTQLADIAKLGFSTYQPSSNAGPANESTFLNLDVNFGAGLNGYQGRLVYVPAVNGSVQQNQWQNWETTASNGLWTWSHYYSNGNKWPDGNTNEYRSWSDIVSAFPNASVAGQLLVRAGNPDNHTFVGYTDHVYMATAAKNINYNFEIMPPSVPTAILKDAASKTISNGYINTKDFTFYLSSSPDVTHYQLKYWNNIPGSAFNGEANAWSPTDLHAAGHMNTLGIYTDNFTQGEGTHYFAFSACDAANICSPFSAPFVVTYDITPPAKPALTSPSNGAYVNGASITQTWSDSSSDVDHYIYQSYNDAAMHSLRYQTTYTGSSKTATNVADGTVYYWRVAAVDHAGNQSSWSDLWKITVDSTPPTAGITSASQPSKNILSFNGYVNDTNFNYYYCWLTEKGNSSEISGTRGANCITTWAKDLQKNGNPATSTDQGEGSPLSPAFLGNFDIAGLASGAYTIHLIAVDRASNQSSEITYDTTIDHTAPTLTINSYTGTSTTPTITGTTSDASDVVTVDGNAATVSQTANTNGTYTWSYTLPTQTIGTHTSTVVSTDQAGNATVGTANVTVTAAFTPQVLGASTTTGTTPTQSSNHGTTVTITPNNDQHVLGDSTTTPATTNSGSNSGKVQGDSTVNIKNSSDKKSGNFLGLGWWWILVLIAILGFFWFAVARRSNEDNKA